MKTQNSKDEHVTEAISKGRPKLSYVLIPFFHKIWIFLTHRTKRLSVTKATYTPITFEIAGPNSISINHGWSRGHLDFIIIIIIIIIIIFSGI